MFFLRKNFKATSLYFFIFLFLAGLTSCSSGCGLLDREHNGICVPRFQRISDSDTGKKIEKSSDHLYSLSVRYQNYANFPALDVSWGQKAIFSGVRSQELDLGLEDYRNGAYGEAQEHFLQAFQNQNKRNPEPLIFFNNSRALQSDDPNNNNDDPLTLAVVVSVGKEAHNAEEILRGVSRAQHEFNKRGGLAGRMLEVIVINDDNEPKLSVEAASAIVQDQSVLGVVGHNFSSATAAALPIYNEHGLPIISSTSTSTKLMEDNKVFFRTVPSDRVSGQKLANYTLQAGISNAIVFFESNDTYSESLKDAFKQEFEDQRQNSEILEFIDMNDAAFRANRFDEYVRGFNHTAIILFPGRTSRDKALNLIRVSKRRADNLDQKILLLGGDSLFSIQTLQDGGISLENLILSVPWFPDFEQYKEFAYYKDSSKALWNGKINWRTAMSFDATQVFLEAFRKSAPIGINRSTILDSLKDVALESENTSGEDLRFKSRERDVAPVFVKTVPVQNPSPDSLEVEFSPIYDE